MIAAPMFHSWGYAHFSLALPLASTLVLRRRFDAEDTIRAAAHHRASTLVLVPVMLQRILDLGPETLGHYDLRGLRVIALSGSALPGDLATRAMDVFGDVLYNLYGSTEVAWATIATPEDLRAAPGTAGAPSAGTIVRLLDAEGREVPAGATGRIFVGNEMMFDGYTGGGGKEIIGGLMSTGDVGRLDGEGRLFVEGRDDEMIVSGGENVFPREVEDLLAEHPEIEEVSRRRRRRRGLRPAAAGVRGRARPARAWTRKGSRPTSRAASRASRCRGRSSSSMSSRATRRARS